MMRHVLLVLLAVCGAACGSSAPAPSTGEPLWQVYERSLKGAKYVDLTHTIAPGIPVWAGFGPRKLAHYRIKGSARFVVPRS